MAYELCKFCGEKQTCNKECSAVFEQVEEVERIPDKNYDQKGVPFMSYAESRRVKNYQPLNFNDE